VEWEAAEQSAPSLDQVMTMSAILSTTKLTQQSASRLDHRPQACGCGQDLELAGEHCPRCGTQLGAPRRESIGFAAAA
jgi:predicted amidophosphoribosyltransferase